MSFTGSQADFIYAVYQVRQSARKLVEAGPARQSQLLEGLANVLEKAQDTILEANTLDLEAGLEMALPELVIDWLKLTPERLQTTVRILRRLSSLGDPRIVMNQSPSRLNQTVAGYSQVVPLGVIALVYEAFPELAAIAAGLCLRTGNGLILKGGNEASQTNQVITQLITQALQKAGLPEECILSLAADQGEAARTWLMQSEGLDLIIPYGRPSLIQQVLKQATVPVLSAAIGNCYLYWAASGDGEMVTRMVLDSHCGEPDAVNAIEKILIHETVSSPSIALFCRQLRDQGFQLRGDGPLLEEVPDLQPVATEEWNQPYLNRTVALRRVESLDLAVTWINRHSSGHANCLVTESYKEHCQFTQAIQSTAIYVNASPRFSRNPAQISAISLGMTARRGRFSGLIGLDALMTVKQIIQGVG